VVKRSNRGERSGRKTKRTSLAERLVYFLVRETGGREDEPVADGVFDSLGAVLTAFCLCDPEPIVKAQEVCGAIQREVTLRVTGIED
jgi:hypothetical protein